MASDNVFCHRLSIYKMFLDDALQYFRCAISIPGSIRVNEGDGPVHADLQAVGFRTIDAGLAR